MNITIEIICPHCRSSSIVKNGKKRNRKQNYRCKDCGRQFIKKADRFEKRSQQLVSRHNQNDAGNADEKTRTNDTESEREKKAAEQMMEKADCIKNFLKETRGGKDWRIRKGSAAKCNR